MKQIYILVFSIFSVGSLQAKQPLYIEFSQMIEQSSLIVVANSIKPIGVETYITDFYEINVVTVLKGKQVDGIYKVKRGRGAASMPTGTEFIAFINQNNEFEWYGMPIGQNMSELKENDILKLAGFYDFNAYLVSPSTITLGQLKNYLKEKKYNTHITGNLYCFSNTTKKIEATTVQIEIEYTYTQGKISSSTKINGLTWNGFPVIPKVSVSAWNHEIDIEYETNGYRGFTLKGEILPTPNTNGDQQAIFWVTEPLELNFDELNTYLNNDINGFPCYELEVVTAKNETYLMVLGEEMGRTGWINYKGNKLSISSYNIDPYWPREIVSGYISSDKLVISLDSMQVTKDQLNYTYEKMVREVKINPIKGKIVLRNAKEEDTFITFCELRYKTTRFTKNVNYDK